ncbi:MAG: molybdopterin-dependent oxidoreductase [Chloroflexi bacterium]|nr:molybdopterin-dependent oxidoreductase [Chloroflexota bacterium]
MPLLNSGLTRRQFLQALGASGVGAVAFTGCQPLPRELQAQSRVRLAEDTLAAYENWYATACRQCEAGCGLVVRVIEGRAKKVEGNPDHPLNRGKLCARGQAVVQEQYHPDRVQGPLRRAGDRGAGAFTPISWDQALDELVGRLRELQGRSEAVALLTRPLRAHSAMLVERFTRAAGARWLTLDPLGAESPLRSAARRILGQEVLPQFDLQRARYVLSFGADVLGAWLSPVHYGVQYGIFRQGDYRAGTFQPRRDRPRGYLVQVEPRFSATAASADAWLPIRPGSEGRLALSLAQVILAEGLADPEGGRAFGDPRALDPYQPERVAQASGVSAERIRQLARDFATRRPSLALGGGPAGAQTNGADNLAAVLALNYLVGGVGREGGVRFNPPPPIQNLPGAVQASRLADWQALAEGLRAGQVQAVLVRRANPVYGLPAALGFRDALLQAPFIASFSSFLDETTALADLVLPAHLPLEDWGDDVPDPGPGFAALTLQQPVVRPFYDTRSFWDTLLAVAEALGGQVRREVPWRTFKDLLREGAQALQGQPGGNIQEADPERFWVQLLQQGGWWDEAAAPPAGGPATLPAQSLQQLAASLRPAEFAGAEQEFPFHLVVFPHTTLGAGETAHLAWLQAAPDPVTSVAWQTWVELSSSEAAQRGLHEGDIVALESLHGRVEVPVYIHPAAPPGVLAMPMGQGHAGYGRWAEGRGANPMALLAPLADEATGALAYAATRVRLTPTGRHLTLPKFEGNVPAFQVPEAEVLKT